MQTEPAPIDRPGLPELATVAALVLLLVLAVALALGAADGPQYSAHLRTVMLLQLVLIAEVALIGLALWLAIAGQHARLAAQLKGERTAAKEREQLVGASTQLADASRELARVIDSERQTATALHALAEHVGLDVIQTEGR